MRSYRQEPKWNNKLQMPELFELFEQQCNMLVNATYMYQPVDIVIEWHTITWNTVKHLLYEPDVTAAALI